MEQRKGMLIWRKVGVTSCLRPATAGDLRLTYSNQLQVTGVKREIMEYWGDSEVKQLLLKTEDQVIECFSETVNAPRKANVTQALLLSCIMLAHCK